MNIREKISRKSSGKVSITVSTMMCCYLLLLSACGSLTGIPSHGGGKRFAIEQEMVAAATRATIKQIDLSLIKGMKINLFVNTIGDQGSGNIVGGRLNFVSQLRGDYIQNPAVIEKSHYPRFTTTSTTTASNDSESDHISSSSDSSSSTLSSSMLNSADKKITTQGGESLNGHVGVEYGGLGTYRNSEEIPSEDLHYLTGLLETYMFLQGVHISPPSEAEVDVYVIVDVFGTVRTRVDWFLANNEILRAKTSLEMMAVDHVTGELIMGPQSAATEAEYNEQYVLWMGPISIKKFLNHTDPLLADFTDLPQDDIVAELKEIDVKIPYPFRRQVETWGDE